MFNHSGTYSVALRISSMGFRRLWSSPVQRGGGYIWKVEVQRQWERSLVLVAVGEPGDLRLWVQSLYSCTQAPGLCEQSYIQVVWMRTTAKTCLLSGKQRLLRMGGSSLPMRSHTTPCHLLQSQGSTFSKSGTYNRKWRLWCFLTWSHAYLTIWEFPSPDSPLPGPSTFTSEETFSFS